jgi:hypothetical protein
MMVIAVVPFLASKLCLFSDGCHSKLKKPFALSLREIREIVVKDFSSLLDELQNKVRVKRSEETAEKRLCRDNSGRCSCGSSAGQKSGETTTSSKHDEATNY